jgi:hypothetical protein
MIKNFPQSCKAILLSAWILAVWLLPTKGSAQEAYQNLYKSETVLKHKIRGMTVELYALAESQDSNNVGKGDPDFRERFKYDAEGRPSAYEATDINIKKAGTPGPHQISLFEYSDNGRTCHRHDTTVFGSADEWHFYMDSTGRLMTADMMKSGNDFRSVLRNFQYDAKGRLEKTKSSRYQVANDPDFECNWTFKVHDNYSFTATSLSPQEMARCQCTLDYYDTGKHVRSIDYDKAGNISKGVLYNYDRTGKPIKLEMLAQDGKTVTSHADIIYDRNGVVKINVVAAKESDPEVNKIAMLARAFLVNNWADWRLLREVRIMKGGKETSRYVFSYDLRS